MHIKLATRLLLRPNCGFPIAQRRQLQQPQPLPTPAVPRPLPQSNQNNQAVTIIGLGICALILSPC